MRVLFCGGGTAGHVYPNIAVAETIMKNDPYAKLAYVTSTDGIENSIVPYKKYEISMVRLNKKFFTSNFFKNIGYFFESINSAKKIIREFRPDIIIGTGGYASFPVIYAGNKLKVKTILMESNLIPGKATRLLENKVDKILVNFEESKSYFKKKNKIIRVGNPLRSAYFSLNKQDMKEKYNLGNKKVVVCIGGSLGAKKINESAIELIENYISREKSITLFLGCGKRYYREIKEILKKKRLDRLENVFVHDYIFNMPEIVASADVVISRAGAMTISELALGGKCTILVPSPNVANNHQYKNAELLEKEKGAILITEDKLYSLVDVVKDLLNDDKKRREYEENIKKFALEDTNKLVYKEILSLLQ